MPFLLTIDDGPSEHAKTKLDLLNSQSIKAVWFCLGQNLEKRPEIAKELIKSGHVLANHSFSHPRFSNISLDNALEEITSTDRIIDSLYASVQMQRPAKLFRFPYGIQGGARKEALEKRLHELDFTPIPSQVEFYDAHINTSNDYDWLWSYDIQEWAIGHEHGLRLGFDQIKENLSHYLHTRNKSLGQVILIHDHERTTEYFSELINLLSDNDKFEALSF